MKKLRQVQLSPLLEEEIVSEHYISVVVSSIKCIQMSDASQGVVLAFMVYRTLLKLPNFCHENQLGLVTLNFSHLCTVLHRTVHL